MSATSVSGGVLEAEALILGGDGAVHVAGVIELAVALQDETGAWAWMSAGATGLPASRNALVRRRVAALRPVSTTAEP
jgi:hypothetical protein